MELTRELQALIDRAWVLHGRLTDDIGERNKLCGFSHHYGLAGTQFDEKHRMLAIRDSVKEVVQQLILLQRLKSCQEINQNTQLARYEESRCHLLRKVTQYQGREYDVVKEFGTHCNDGKSIVYDPKVVEKLKNKTKSRFIQEGKKRTASFLISCIKKFLTPWKWQKTVRIAAKLIVLSASISVAVNSCRSRQQNFSSRSLLMSQTNGDVMKLSERPLHVSYGRG